jgi:GR25 family glycosyltransferase involved in LPS biosynthesis
MLLINKISLGDFLSYKQEHINCLIHNSNNGYISEIFVFIDGETKDLPKHPKIKYFVKKYDEYQLLEISKKYTSQSKIIWSKKSLIGFNEDLRFLLTEPSIYKTKDFIIINKDTKISKDLVIDEHFKNPKISTIDFGTIHKKNNPIEKELKLENIRRKGDLVKSKNLDVFKKLNVIIVSVNYNDFLLPTLTINIETFDNITVVTSNEDKMCQMICEKFKVNYITTDIMYDEGAKFNKGKAINLGINSIKDPGFILLIDADIIVKDRINTEYLDTETLYTSDRWMCETYDDLYKWETDVNSLKKHIKNESDRGLGFFQLFHYSKAISYPETSENAAFSDLLFRDKFTKKQTIKNQIIHLGKSYTNWDGRKTDRFIEDTEFQRLFESIGQNKFDINSYFDKIYCLNLERNSEKWQKTNTQFKKLNINVDRFLGIDGNNISDDEFNEISNRKISEVDSSKLGLIENKYALGCLMSHIEIIKEAKSAGYKRILIFEDDVILSNEFNERISQINKLNWELLYLGASQFNWSGVKVNNGFYKCSNTLGTFAYAINSNIYDDLLELFETKRKSIDNLLSEYQLKNNQSFVIYPNIVISDVSQSDIRQSKSMNEYSKLMKWNLESFTSKPENFISKEKLKVLLVPDRPGWAFDNISKSLKKYNPYVDEIEYDIIYIIEIHSGKKINYDNYDYIYVLWEAERNIPDSKKIIRGCYSAFWLENQKFSPEVLSEYFSKCSGGIFANDFLKESLSRYLPNNYPMSVIHDSSDETIFYPIDGLKKEKFTAIFVGNITRKVKNFETIQKICKETDIGLIACSDIKNERLVNYYNQADICINFSEFEGGPQTFIESSLCGVPMLIRDNNELSKLIPCFKGETKEDFVRIINELKEDRNLCQEVGKKAMEVAIEKFTYKKAAENFGKFFLNLKNGFFDKKDLSKELTVFVISCGENPNYNDCISALENQNVIFKIKEIKNVCPMSAAFQKMIDDCDTDYYIQVDEDMILFEDTIEKIYQRLCESDSKISTVAHMLTDAHLDFDIYGIKGYKHKILKKYPYNLEIISCEVEQISRLQKDGFETLMYQDVVGYHSPKWNEQLIYERYFDLMEKWKVFKYDWLDELPSKLFEIFKSEPNNINLYALMGAMTSVSNEEPMRKREKNFLIKDENFERIENFLSLKEFTHIIKSEKSESPQILTKNLSKK